MLIILNCEIKLSYFYCSLSNLTWSLGVEIDDLRDSAGKVDYSVGQVAAVQDRVTSVKPLI
jgi:hypothetical protein